MIISPTIPKETVFSGSPEQANYLWENLVIEKRISVNWLHKIYKESLVDAFWSVFSAKVR